MKIGLFGQFGGGNSGNDGSLEAMILFLRAAYPEAELVGICPNPDKVAEDFAISALGTGRSPTPPLSGTGAAGAAINRFLNILYPFRKARDLDVLIVPGTGFLDDFQEKPFGWPFMIFRWCLAARLAGAKIAFVSIGAGPIRHPISRRFMTLSARMSHFCSYRDTISRAFMAGIGSGTECDPVFPDLVFRLPVPAVSKPGPDPERCIGVGVMTYSGWMRNSPHGTAIYRNYLDKLAQFITWVIAQNYKVRILTGDKGDEAAVSELLSRLGALLPVTSLDAISVRPTRTLQQLMQQIARTELVVGTRFHNVVCALKLVRPVISLSYAAKNDALLADVGLQGFSQHVEDFQLDVLKEQFALAMEKRSDLQARIATAVKRYGELLIEQEMLLDELLLPPDRYTSAAHARPGLSGSTA